MGVGIELEKVTIGTTVLGKREGANAALADAIIASPFRQVDTSNNYADGASERELGDAIRRAGGLPEGKLVFTKVDRDPVTDVFDADRVLRSVEESLTRLGLERVPLLHFHDPYVLSVSEAMAPGGPVEALVRLREEGVAGAIGVAMGTTSLIHEYLKTGAFDAFLSHNRYTILDRQSEEVMDYAVEHGITVFNAAPFGGGLLAGKEGGRYGYKPATDEFLAFLDAFRALCEEYRVAAPAAALQFSMREPRIDSTVVGMYSLERLNALSDLVDAEIPDAFWDGLAALGSPPASDIDYR